MLCVVPPKPFGDSVVIPLHPQVEQPHSPPLPSEPEHGCPQDTFAAWLAAAHFGNEMLFRKAFHPEARIKEPLTDPQWVQRTMGMLRRSNAHSFWSLGDAVLDGEEERIFPILDQGKRTDLFATFKAHGKEWLLDLPIELMPSFSSIPVIEHQKRQAAS